MTQIIKYSDFRLGLTFKDVRRMMKEESQARQWNGLKPLWVTRKTVIGRMHQLKLEAYEYYTKAVRSAGDGEDTRVA